MKIAGYNYKIIYSDDLLATSGLMGEFDKTKGEITIDTHLTDEQKKSTLLHEIIEAINYHFDLNLEHNKIMTLETALYQVLKDNNEINI